MSTTSRPPNRLSQETSPYLLQHANNPVDWYPWGEDALRAAREQDKPIFLSIGYSACHWCHVMEHESFESEEIAALMNRWFINIKVDREERPDLDQIYMSAVVALTGQGGWPMSVFLSPDLKPFFGGTYWPPTSRWGRPGFADVLQGVQNAWENRRDALLSQGQDLTGAVVQMSQPQGTATPLTEAILQGAGQALLRAADRTHGGFGGAPKFPHPMDLRVLLRVWKRFGTQDALDVVQLTLDKMARGGIYDQLGGGFHRYSTDAEWLAPHFEKMLYDNALLVPVYLEAYQATGQAEQARIVRETLDYVLREMTQPAGGFYSTQDADSEGEEGKFFVWSPQELDDALGADDAHLCAAYFDVTAAGNWEGSNILRRLHTHGESAQQLGMPEEELTAKIERCRRRLLEVRSQRVAPGRDDKVLVSWNGLMMTAMAMAAQVLSEPRYADAARGAADFILETLRDESGRLLHVYKDGRARLNAYLDNYACLIEGLVEVYQATFAAQYLEAALELAERMIEQFHDAERGGFFYTSADHETLIARTKDSQDNATPSGNGMAATALLRLARLCNRSDLEDKAVEVLNLLSGQLARAPMAGGQSLIALDFLLGPSVEIALVAGSRPDDLHGTLRGIHGHFLPNKVIAFRSHAQPDSEVPAQLRSLFEGRQPREELTTAYICCQGACDLPITGAQAITATVRTL